MGTSRRRRSGWISAEGLAGWVFADIMIVLFLVGLGSQAPPEVRPKANPKPPRPPRIVGMRPRAVVRHVRYDQASLLAGRGERRRVCWRVRAATKQLRGERAALVLIFAGGSVQQINGAISAARAVGRQLPCARKAYRGSVTRAFWEGGLPAGRARLETFVYTRRR